MGLIKTLLGLFSGGKKEETKAVTFREIRPGKVQRKDAAPAVPRQEKAKAPAGKPAEKPAERSAEKAGERPARKPRAPKAEAPKKERVAKVRSDAPLIEDFVAEPWDVAANLPEELEGKTRFADMGLLPPILRGIHDIGFQYCTDIQAQILPHTLKGSDVTGKAQTGTGKTAAFLLTILQHLMTTKARKKRKEGAPRALIMAPTRELVMQIEKDARELAKYCGGRILAIFGGMDYEKQRDALEDDYVDIVVATPGRILDYYKQRIITLSNVEILVLDEADRMLDMGFLPDMRRIIDATPPKSERQTMLFSATLTPEITRLSALWTNTPINVEIEPEHITNTDVEQLAYIISEEDKFALLFNLLSDMQVTRAIVFANRKDQVRRLTDRLKLCDFNCDMLTGDVSQAKRIKTLENLRGGRINILIATDVAGRGIHVDGIDVVFNYTLPNDPDDYVHRIGRTGRAGAKGVSVSFASEEDSYVLPQIEEHIKLPLKYLTPDEHLLAPVPEKYVIKFKNLKRKRSDAPMKHGSKPFDKRKRGPRT